jgi:putative transposase
MVREEHHIVIEHTRPGKPSDNAFVESFNGKIRDECFNEHWFLSIPDAQSKIEQWRNTYNEERPP